MITNKQIINTLRQYEGEFTKRLRDIHIELTSIKPDLLKLSEMSAETTEDILNFIDLLTDFRDINRKTKEIK